MPWYVCNTCNSSYNTEFKAIECEKKHEVKRCSFHENTIKFVTENDPSLVVALTKITNAMKQVFEKYIPDPDDRDSMYDYEFFDYIDLSVTWVDNDWYIAFYYKPNSDLETDCED